MHEQADDAFPDLKDETRLNMLAEKWHRSAEFCLCRVDNNKLVGMIAFYANQPLGNVVFIPHVYVNQEYRGKGLFASMLVKVKQCVSERGFRVIRLEVKKDNVRAQKAYQNNGFCADGSSKEGAIYMIFNF